MEFFSATQRIFPGMILASCVKKAPYLGEVPTVYRCNLAAYQPDAELEQARSMLQYQKLTQRVEKIWTDLETMSGG